LDILDREKQRELEDLLMERMLNGENVEDDDQNNASAAAKKDLMVGLFPLHESLKTDTKTKNF